MEYHVASPTRVIWFYVSPSATVVSLLSFAQFESLKLSAMAQDDEEDVNEEIVKRDFHTVLCPSSIPPIFLTLIPFRQYQLFYQVSVSIGGSVETLLDRRISAIKRGFQWHTEAVITYKSNDYIVFESESGDVFDILHRIHLSRFGATLSPRVMRESPVSRIKNYLSKSPLYEKGKRFYEGLNFEETSMDIEKELRSFIGNSFLSHFARLMHRDGEYASKGLTVAVVRKVCLDFYNLLKTSMYKYMLHEIWEMIHWLFVVRFFFYTRYAEEQFDDWMRRYLECFKRHSSFCTDNQMDHIVEYIQLGLPDEHLRILNANINPIKMSLVGKKRKKGNSTEEGPFEEISLEDSYQDTRFRNRPLTLPLDESEDKYESMNFLLPSSRSSSPISSERDLKYTSNSESLPFTFKRELRHILNDPLSKNLIKFDIKVSNVIDNYKRQRLINTFFKCHLCKMKKRGHTEWDCVDEEEAALNKEKYYSTKVKEQQSNTCDMRCVEDCFDFIKFSNVRKRLLENVDLHGIEGKTGSNLRMFLWKKSRQVNSSLGVNGETGPPSLRSIILDRLHVWICPPTRAERIFSIEDILTLYSTGEELQLFDHPALMPSICKLLVSEFPAIVHARSFSNLNQEQVDDFHYAFATKLFRTKCPIQSFIGYLNLVESSPLLQSRTAKRHIFDALITQDTAIPLYKIAKFNQFNFIKTIAQDILFKDISTFDYLIQRCESAEVQGELAADFQKYIQNYKVEKEETQDHLISPFIDDEFDDDEYDSGLEMEYYSEEEDYFDYENTFSQE